jgi:hypothetical protein
MFLNEIQIFKLLHHWKFVVQKHKLKWMNIDLVLKFYKKNSMNWNNNLKKKGRSFLKIKLTKLKDDTLTKVKLTLNLFLNLEL